MTYCPRCWGNPELWRDGVDAFCVFCGYRRSYVLRKRTATLSARYDFENEIKVLMQSVGIPNKEAVKR